MIAPKTYQVAELRHLRAALNYRGTSASGQACVLWSAALALDLRAVLTFGTLRAAEVHEFVGVPGRAEVPFIHAWVEAGAFVYAPTTNRRTAGLLMPMARDHYYEVNGVTDARSLPPRELQTIARRWRFASALKHLSPRAGDRAFPEELMRAAGVRWHTGPSREILPG